MTLLFGTVAALAGVVAVSYLVEALRRPPPTPEVLPWAPDIPIRHVSVNGIGLRYIEAGSGPVLVLLHTMRTQLDLFQRVVPALATRYHVYAVDLPGHGYAQVSRSKVKGWTRLVDAYIRGRPNLMRVLLLVDSKVGTKDADDQLMDLMDESGLSYQIVMTKADRLKPAELDKMRSRLATKLGKRPACHPDIPVTSAEDGTGIAEMRQALAAFAS